MRRALFVLPLLAMACGDSELNQEPDTAQEPASTTGGTTEETGNGHPATTEMQEPPVEIAPTGSQVVHDPRRGPPYPIVLVHGLNGFRDLGPVDYFYQVPSTLEDAGHEVYVTAVAPYDSSPHRARALAEQIDAILDESGARKVNIIAHSQGGLDSRWLISKLGYGDRIASLTTVSTPHRGTRVADVIFDADFPGRDAIIDGYAWLFGEISRDAMNNPDGRAALSTLSTAQALEFNRDVVNDPRVTYFSWAGRSNLQQADDVCGDGERPNPDAVDVIEAALLPTWTLLAETLTNPEANDGLVPVSSAKWGRFLGCIPADHADEIGQLLDLGPGLVSGFDHKQFYLDHAAFLRDQGF